MNWFQKWVLKGIVKNTVKQGGHSEKLIEFYGMIIQGADKEFTEDNNVTLDYFLTDCHNEALQRYLKW